MLIDTHCHINFPDKFPDPAATIAEARENGVTRLFAVGCDPDSSQAAVELAEQFEAVYAIVGWHPTYVKAYSPGILQDIRKMLAHPKVVALGEIGLDYHWDYSTPEEQRVALDDQLNLALELDVPVVFHCRDAYPDLLTILEGRPSHPYLFHCWAGDVTDAERALALGCYFGVDGPISYKNANALREIFRMLPKDRVVIETDSPYMTPEPNRGKPNKPAYVKHVAEALAKTWELAFDEVSVITTSNAEKFFRLN